MFLHEIIKGADPAHLVFEGDAVVTYGELEKKSPATEIRCMKWESAKGNV